VSGRRTTLATVAGCLALGLGAEAAAPDAAGLVARHLARFSAMASLTLRVERQTTRKGKTSTERWTLRQKGTSLARVDYEFPVRRHIVANERELWEYLPTARKAARTDLAAMAPEPRQALLRRVLARVAVEGLRFDPGGPDAELRYVARVRLGGREAHCIECRRRGKAGARAVRGWLDAERLVLLRCEFLDPRGQILAECEASRVFEAAPGLWLPRRLTMKHLGTRGFTQVTTLQRVAVDAELPDALFTFRVPEGVEVVAPSSQ